MVPVVLPARMRREVSPFAKNHCRPLCHAESPLYLRDGDFAILLLIFLLDLLIGIPFGRTSVMTDLWFVVSGAALGTIGFFIFRKLK